MGSVVARGRRVGPLSTPRFIVSADELEGEEILLRGAELRHLRARRLGAGAEIVLTDGSGTAHRAIVVAVNRAGATLRIEHAPEVQRAVESPLRLTLAQAALKADKLGVVVEKATELGVSDLVVFASSRCIAKPTSERLQRYERVARSAAKQCQRTCVPSIRGPRSFVDVLHEARESLGLLFWEGAGAEARLTAKREAAPRGVVAIVGPEGGFTTEEVALARAAGIRIVGLGPRTLRAETAAIVAVAMCQSLWGDLRQRE
jgi:16S rRNA (uracil1498-N3)-methyltransferase